MHAWRLKASFCIYIYARACFCVATNRVPPPCEAAAWHSYVRTYFLCLEKVRVWVHVWFSTDASIDWAIDYVFAGIVSSMKALLFSFCANDEYNLFLIYIYIYCHLDLSRVDEYSAPRFEDTLSKQIPHLGDTFPARNGDD